MAAQGQNVIIFDKDEIIIRFNVTDATAALNTGDAWWGVADDASETGTLLFEKSSGTWDPGNQTSTVPAGNADEIQKGATFLNCKITGSDYGAELSSDATYYHELVFSGTSDQESSNVIATGNLTIKRSMFTKLNYR